MAPDIHAEEIGSSESKQGEETVNDVPAERRRVPRVRCSGSVEFHVDGTELRMWGNLTDISLLGCYVEMNTTFPVHTKVHLVLKSFGERVQAAGTVRATYPFLGMGIVFSKMEPAQLQRLEKLMAALAGRNAISGVETVDVAGRETTIGSADPKAFVKDLNEFFRTKSVLSRDEFLEIAKRVRRTP